MFIILKWVWLYQETSEVDETPGYIILGRLTNGELIF